MRRAFVMGDGLREMEFLQGLVNHLKRLYPGKIRLVQLFGSRARGDATPDSDYDVLIVVQDRSAIDRTRIYDYVPEVNLRYGIDLSLKIYGEDEFELFRRTGVPFIREALREGHALWSR